MFITFQSAIKINQFQFRSFVAHLLARNTKAIALRCGQNGLIFITFQSAIKINQFQCRSFFAHFWPKYQGYSPTFWPKLLHVHHFSICNQSQSISNFGHLSLIVGQNTKAIALLLGQNWLMFITFQSAIKINQFQFRSFVAHLWPKYQGYSVTFLDKIASFSSLCNLQSISINFNFGHLSLICGQNTKGHRLTLIFGQNTKAHFHHFSICNQNQSISIWVICRSYLAKKARL